MRLVPVYINPTDIGRDGPLLLLDLVLHSALIERVVGERLDDELVAHHVQRDLAAEVGDTLVGVDVFDEFQHLLNTQRMLFAWSGREKIKACTGYLCNKHLNCRLACLFTYLSYSYCQMHKKCSEPSHRWQPFYPSFNST